MKSIVITEPGHADVTEQEMPSPGPDDVLVRSRAVGICGSDVELCDYSPWVRNPGASQEAVRPPEGSVRAAEC